jgi:hypothetical protein
MNNHFHEPYTDLARRTCQSIRYKDLLAKITRKPITFQSPEECIQVFLDSVEPRESRTIFGEYLGNIEHTRQYLKAHRFLKLEFSTPLRSEDIQLVTINQLRKLNLWLNSKIDNEEGKSRILSLMEELLNNVSDSCFIHLCIVPFAHYEKHFGAPTYLVTAACAANSELIWLGKYFRD